MAPMSYRTRKRKQSKPSKSYSSSSSYSSSTIGSDQISNLPESILEHILFYLPVDDAISLSSVSKTLLRAWNSLAALDFHFDVANIADEYNLQQVVNSIDESLSTLKESKAIIQSFILNINLEKERDDEGNYYSNLVSNRFDDWVSLTMKNYVKEINIKVSDPSETSYTLPQSVFTSRFVVKLYLEGCNFPSLISYTRNDTRNFGFDYYNSLKVLSLLNVVAAQDQIQNLVNLAKPFLEKLIIRLHTPIDLLVLSQFPKLCYVEVEVKVFQLDECPNLETLIMYSLRKVTCHWCPSITTLKCLSWELENAFRSIRTLVSKLLFLETLQLSLSRNEKVKIRSLQLRTLVLFEEERFEDPLEVELETPNVRTVQFHGFCVPIVRMVENGMFMNETRQVKLHHFGHISGGLDGFRLHQLGVFSQFVVRPNVEIYLHHIFTQNLLTLDVLRQHYPVVYHPQVKLLVLECFPTAYNYASFLHCLLWSCHPNSLVLKMTPWQTHSQDIKTFILYLCQELVNWEQNRPLTCCKERELSKCYRHYMEDVECCVYRSIREGEPKDLVQRLEHNGITFIETNTEGVILEFNFQWMQNPIY